MKRLLTYLFLVIGLGLVFSVNTNASVELLKSAIKINEKEKVIYSNFGKNYAYWNIVPLKINDLRGDGIVYYKFEEKLKDNGKYYRVSEDYKVVSIGDFEYKSENRIFVLTEDNKKFLWKISIPSQIADIKSKVYDYKGYRRYQFVEATIKEQDQINSSIKNHEDNKYVKIETNQNDINDASFKSALDIDKKEKIRFLTDNTQRFSSYVFLMDDLRGNGPVYYVFNIDQYHRLDENLNFISRGLYGMKGGSYSEGYKIFELKEDKLKFQWKISLKDEVIDIKSNFYKYKGFKRYHFKKPTKQQLKMVQQSVKNYQDNKYV